MVLLGQFPKLKSYSSNLRCNFSNVDTNLWDVVNSFRSLVVVNNGQQEEDLDLMHKLVYGRYATQLESLEFIPNQYCWLAKCELNFPNLKKLILEDLLFTAEFYEAARSKNFVLPSLTHLALTHKLHFYWYLKIQHAVSENGSFLNWIQLVAPNLQTLEILETDSFNIIDNIIAKTIIIGVPTLQKLLYSFKMQRYDVNCLRKMGKQVEDAYNSGLKFFANWCNRNDGISHRFYEIVTKKNNKFHFFELCVEIDRRYTISS